MYLDIISYTFKCFFLQLKNLCFLDLRWNEIKFLPESFDNLKKLEWIELDWDKVKGPSEVIKRLKSIPEID